MVLGESGVCVLEGGVGLLPLALPCSPLNPTKLHMHTIHTASLGSEFGVLPSGGGSALLPDEEEEEADVDAVGGGRAAEDAGTGGRERDGNDNEEEEEEELSPLHELRDVEAALGDGGFPPPEEDSGGQGPEGEGEGEAVDDNDVLDATLRRGQSHPGSGRSPPPTAPGPPMHGASAPPPLFPPMPQHGTAGTGAGAAARFLPPALATMTPLSSKPPVGSALARTLAAGGAAAGTGAGAGAGAHHHAGGSKRMLGTKDVFWTSAETM